MTRKGAILTYTNTIFYPLEPRLEDVKLEDIAHALSQMCRANGHFKTFYSVAQHSINCAQEARARKLSTRIQLACLLHDGSEAYIADITRPVKGYLDEYRKIEATLQQVIFAKYGLADLTEQELKQLADIDTDLLYYEFEHLHQRNIREDITKLCSQPDIAERSMTAVEEKFIQMARLIMNMLAPQEKGYKCVGIDSCKKGWAAFWQYSSGSYVFKIYNDISALMQEHKDADCLLIDIPIGLPETRQDELARPDQELRKRLPGKKSSVFNTPCRQAVYIQDKQAAKARNIEFLNKSLSEQSLGFSRKIREIDEFLLENPQYIGRLRESHPEYGFAVLNQGKPLLSKKSEVSGLDERIRLLTRYFTYTEQAIHEITSQYRKQVINDFLDAMVLSVIGCIGMQKGFETIPEEPQKDCKGLPMEIVYSRV